MTNEQTFLFTQVRDELLEACRKALQSAAEQLYKAGIVSGVSVVGMFEGSGSAKIELNISTKPVKASSGISSETDGIRVVLESYGKRTLRVLAEVESVEIPDGIKRPGLVELLLATVPASNILEFIYGMSEDEDERDEEKDFDDEDDEEEDDESFVDELMIFCTNDLESLAVEHDLKFKKQSKFKTIEAQRVYKLELATLLNANLSHIELLAFIEEEDEDEDATLIEDLMSEADLNELITFAHEQNVHVKKRKTKKFKNGLAERAYKRDLATSIVTTVSEKVITAFLDSFDTDKEHVRIGKKLVKKVRATPRVETHADRLVSALKANDLKSLCDSLNVSVTSARKIKGEEAPTKLEMATVITAMRKPAEINAALVALNLPHEIN